MGSADVLPTVPRVDLYHRQNVSLLQMEPEKGWVMEIDPNILVRKALRLTKTNKIRNQRTCPRLQLEERRDDIHQAYGLLSIPYRRDW